LAGRLNKTERKLNVCLPLKSGQILKRVMQLVLANWPRVVSMKNKGMPHTASIVRYGTRNAPTGKTEVSELWDTVLGTGVT